MRTRSASTLGSVCGGPVATAETHRVARTPHQRAPLASAFRRAPAPAFSPGSTRHALGPRHRDGAASKVGSQTPAGPCAPRQERRAEHHALLPAAAAAPPQRPPRRAIRAACARDDRQATERAADQVSGGPTRSRVRYVDHGCSELAAVSIRGRRGYSIASRARGRARRRTTRARRSAAPRPRASGSSSGSAARSSRPRRCPRHLGSGMVLAISSIGSPAGRRDARRSVHCWTCSTNARRSSPWVA